MCILFIYVDPNAKEGQYRLIIASNRDEYYKRPAENLQVWEKTGIIGGKDVEPGREGGMWLGVKTKENDLGKKFCFAALLNITGEKFTNVQGRGVLIPNYLQSNIDCTEYIEQLKQTNSNYNGYNFVAAELSDREAKIYLHGNTPDISETYTGKQILGFGNSPINSPLNKVQKGRQQFEEIIKRDLTKEELMEQLLNLLRSDVKHLPDEELQKRAPAACEFLSSIFVKIEEAGYGTRAHSIILVDYDWTLEFIEESLDQPIDIKNPRWNQNVIKSKI